MSNINVSEWIINALVEHGVTDIFGYPGSLICFFIEALRKDGRIKQHLCRHEQGCGFAATGYARYSGKLCAAYATSGPGASNLITAIAHAYYESVPTVFITANVHTDDNKGDKPIRQIGNQEYDIVSAVKDITKYAVQITDANSAPFHIERAIYEAMNERPGPVLLDLPVNVSRTTVESPDVFTLPAKENYDVEKIAVEILCEIHNAKKPVILAGQGISISGTRTQFAEFIKRTRIPVVTSMSAVDLVPNYGFIGANGNKEANALLDECDLLITFGTRVNVRHLRGNSFFSNDKKLIRTDIDKNEFLIRFKQNEVDYLVDLRDLWKELLKN